MASGKEVKLQDLSSNVNVETRSVQLLVDKLNHATLSHPEKHLVAKFESSQANKILKDMVTERLLNYNAGSLTIEQVKVVNQKHKKDEEQMKFNQGDRRPVKMDDDMYTNLNGKTTIYNFQGGDFVITKYNNIIKK